MWINKLRSLSRPIHFSSQHTFVKGIGRVTLVDRNLDEPSLKGKPS